MLARLELISGIPASVLEPEIRAVHQKRGTSEYSNLLNELPSLRSSDARTPLARFDEAIHEMNIARRANTNLYPRVMETLLSLRERGVTIVAYTESIAYWTEWRIKHTGLDGVVDILYSAPDHDLPKGMTFDDLRTLPPEEYGLKITDHRHVPKGSTKPNGGILRSILNDCHRTPEEAVYIGDSLMKDIVMAQRAGVPDVHAKYGEAQRLKEYALLRRLSHWPDRDVERERELAESATNEVRPTRVLTRGFWEILDIPEFQSHWQVQT